jgi:hypothetical protein
MSFLSIELNIEHPSESIGHVLGFRDLFQLTDNELVRIRGYSYVDITFSPCTIEC